jgi:hypothetical protein
LKELGRARKKSRILFEQECIFLFFDREERDWRYGVSGRRATRLEDPPTAATL